MSTRSSRCLPSKNCRASRLTHYSRYRFWRVTFWMGWGGAVFTAGWVLRVFGSYNPDNLNLYIAQTCLILGGPPIFAAAEYNILGRLMHYVPMHAPLNPGRLVIFFVYVGAAVESLTAAGAAMRSGGAVDNPSAYRTGGLLIAISLILQAAVEILYISLVNLMHRRCKRAGITAKNLRTLFWMLYGTAFLVLFRCVFRVIEAFGVDFASSAEECGSLCNFFLRNEWYLFVFEGASMVLYTYWLNIIHPGRFLPRNKMRYLDTDGQTERMGPGWVDKRSKWETFADPWDLTNTLRGEPKHEKYWLQAGRWAEAQGGSFALGTATNVGSPLKINTRASKGAGVSAGTKYSPLDGQDV